MVISRDLKDRAQKTREDGVFTLNLDEGVSLAIVGRLCPGYVPWREHRGYRRLASGLWCASSLSARGRNSRIKLKGRTTAFAADALAASLVPPESCRACCSCESLQPCASLDMDCRRRGPSETPDSGHPFDPIHGPLASLASLGF
jgi:hypothetical protein